MRKPICHSEDISVPKKPEYKNSIRTMLWTLCLTIHGHCIELFGTSGNEAAEPIAKLREQTKYSTGLSSEMARKKRTKKQFVDSFEVHVRVVIATALSLLVAASVAAEPSDSSNANCFDRIAQEIPTDQTITIVMTDSSSFRCIMPVVIASASSLHIVPIRDTGYQSSVVVPFHDIARITYIEPSLVRHGFVLLGLGLGAYAGGAAGRASSRGSKNLDFSGEAGAAITGALIGGIVGAVCGYEIGRHFTTTVTLKCP